MTVFPMQYRCAQSKEVYMDYTLNFTTRELQIIDEALGNMPYRKVAELIDNINSQIDAQKSK